MAATILFLFVKLSVFYAFGFYRHYWRYESLEVFHAIARNAGYLGLKVIAAGIETPEQLDKVRGMQCAYGQGYFFSKPVEGQAVKTLVGKK